MQIQIKTELNIEKKKILKRCHFLLSYMLNSGELGGTSVSTSTSSQPCACWILGHCSVYQHYMHKKKTN